VPAISEADREVAALLMAIAELVAAESADRVRGFSTSLKSGTLAPGGSIAMAQNVLALPHVRLKRFSSVLDAAAQAGVTSAETALAVDAGLASVERVRESIPRLEVARTGPSSRTFELRSTGSVSREIVESSQATLLLVGYSVSVSRDRTGLASETVDAIAAAASRGVRVTAVLHRDPVNREALLRNWPSYARQPVVFTWPESPTDTMTKLHAKVLVADRSDALVTSANLTYHGLESNIELGLRVSGVAAAQIEAHFRDLIRQDELVSWPVS
jgi:cardiolipin synthase